MGRRVKATHEAGQASGTLGRDIVDHSRGRGLLFGGVGVLAFSGTLPATRLAVPAFGPAVLTCGRIVVAAALGAVALWLLRRHSLPRGRHIAGILWTGMGLAIGYPLFVAIAMEHVPASHGALVVGLAPATTAILSVIRTGERLPLRFWLASSTGVMAVVIFALAQGGEHIALADAWLVAAAVSVGLGYVEGGRVSRELGGTVTLCWAMNFLCPIAVLALITVAAGRDWPAISWGAWAGFAYAGIVSMFLGSVAWYEGLAVGGIARIGQLNLISPSLHWDGRRLSLESRSHGLIS